MEHQAKSGKQIVHLLPDSIDDREPDLEGQARDTKESQEIAAVEYFIPASTKCLYLSLYFALNLALTMYNKAVLGTVGLHYLTKSTNRIYKRC